MLESRQFHQFELAKLYAEMQAIKSHVYEIYNNEINKLSDTTIDATSAKFKVNNFARKLAKFSLQVHGANGYLKNTFISKFYTDSRGLAIAGGTDEMMLEIISKHIKKKKSIYDQSKKSIY